MKVQHTIAMMGIGLAVFCRANTYLSPEYVALTPDGKTLYVTAATAKKIVKIDSATDQVVAEWTLKANPSGIAVATNGTLYITGGAEEGKLFKVNAAGKTTDSLEIGHTPLAPVVSADGKTVYVLNRFNNNVMVVDTDNMKIVATIPVVREPHAAVLAGRGKLLFVANHLPYVRATDDVVAATVSVIDTATHKVLKTMMLPNGSTGVRGTTASPDGKFVYVTHTFGRYQLPTTQLERGWMNTAGLSVFNGETGDYINTVLLDDVDLGAANPWGITVSPDGKTLVVAHAGTREISVIDREALHVRLEKAAKGEKVTEVTKSATDVPNDLSFLVTIRRRVKIEGDGPRGIIICGGSVYVACYFSERVVHVNLADSVLKPMPIVLTKDFDLLKDRVRRGEMLFNDGAMCFQQWQSCASCHPDARADALNWDLINDGIGNPKQTKNMLFSHLTPPTMVTGIREGMAMCNRKGLTHIQFVVRPDEDATCIDAYVMSLKPVPSPYLKDGALTKSAKRGEKVFKKAGCVECHPSNKKSPEGYPLFTDLRLHPLLGIGNEEGRAFDTTSLTEIWRTAPYLYDGRALTMEEVLTTCNPKDIHGATKNLSKEEVKDLTEYILSY
jgi:YVTN family beta-propeller protein